MEKYNNILIHCVESFFKHVYVYQENILSNTPGKVNTLTFVFNYRGKLTKIQQNFNNKFFTK